MEYGTYIWSAYGITTVILASLTAVTVYNYRLAKAMIARQKK